MKVANTQEDKDEIGERIVQQQKEITDRVEAKEVASRERFSHFNATGVGTMQPQSFYCIKETHASRKINRLEVQGQIITDPDDIVQYMQEY